MGRCAYVGSCRLQVTVEGGEKLYESTTVDPATRKLLPAGWKSVGQRQRVRPPSAPPLPARQNKRMLPCELYQSNPRTAPVDHNLTTN